MTYIPHAQELGCKYWIRSPAPITEAILNDTAEANYVGMAAEVTGLDSSEVRESAEDLVEADGGAHGSFYFGRRPITMNIKVYGHATRTARTLKLDRLQRAINALRADGTLWWQTEASLAIDPAHFFWVPFRLQQPKRETGGWVKDVQIALVSQYAVIFGDPLKTSGSIASGGAGLALENRGSYPSYPIIEITGASTNPVVNSSNGGSLKTTGLTLAAGEVVQFDALNHTGVFTVGARTGQSANRYINFATTLVWPSLTAAGNTTFTLTGGGSAVVKWRDVWL